MILPLSTPPQAYQGPLVDPVECAVALISGWSPLATPTDLVALSPCAVQVVSGKSGEGLSLLPVVKSALTVHLAGQGIR